MSDPLSRAVSTVVVDCLGVKAGETVCVLTDPGKRSIADAITRAARDLGAETILLEISERETDGAVLPDAIAAALLACDVMIAPTTRSASHTEARRQATAAGVRAATMPKVTEDMLVRTMSADYGKVRERSKRVAEVLTEGVRAHIVSDAGTDLTLVLEGRAGIADDGDLRASGAFGNLPAGEGFIAPVEGAAEGRVVFDGSVPPIGRVQEPVVVEIHEGYATGFSGDRADEVKELLARYGRDALAVAELGVGTNEAAVLTGNVLEDEKILGTIHVAFGDNHTIGGTTTVPSHQDGVVLAPTLTVDDVVVIEAGRFALD